MIYSVEVVRKCIYAHIETNTRGRREEGDFQDIYGREIGSEHVILILIVFFFFSFHLFSSFLPYLAQLKLGFFFFYLLPVYLSVTLQSIINSIKSFTHSSSSNQINYSMNEKQCITPTGPQTH